MNTYIAYGTRFMNGLYEMNRKVKIDGKWMVNTEFIHKQNLNNQISLNNSRPVSKGGFNMNSTYNI